MNLNISLKENEIEGLRR